MALTFQQREQLWINNGGNPLFAPVAAAISMAENAAGTLGSNSDSGCNCGGSCYSWGLWQINCSNVSSLISAGVIKTEADLGTANGNAAAAVYLSGGSKSNPNFSPWTTYWSNDGGKTNVGNGNGIFNKFLPGGSTIPSSTTQQTSGVTQTPSQSSSGSCPQAGSLQCIFRPDCGNCWQPGVQNLLSGPLSQGTSVVIVAAGAITFLLIGGLWIALSNNDTRKIIVQSVKDAAAS